jgi:DNA primase
VIAVEGYIDVIACVGAGFEATVAPLGTALTEDQLQLLWGMADEPILCFDGDEAGLKAAFRAIDVALPHLKPGKSLKFALLPEGQDPDDLIRKEGAETFRQVLGAAKPMVDMLIFRESRGVDFATPERRAGLDHALRNAVAAIRDNDVRRHYEAAIRERIARQFGANSTPARRFERGRGGIRSNRYPEATGPSPSLLSDRLVRAAPPVSGASPALSDAVLLGLLILHPEIAAERLELLGETEFSGSAIRALAGELALRIAENPGIEPAELNSALQEAGHGPAIHAVGEKLRRSGLGTLAAVDSERAAAVWDDAAHLRLRAGALSNERLAAAQALGRDTSDVHLSRLRDIQEQDQRSLRPDESDETAGAGIVHPFKRR